MTQNSSSLYQQTGATCWTLVFQGSERNKNRWEGDGKVIISFLLSFQQPGFWEPLICHVVTSLRLVAGLADACLWPSGESERRDQVPTLTRGDLTVAPKGHVPAGDKKTTLVWDTSLTPFWLNFPRCSRNQDLLHILIHSLSLSTTHSLTNLLTYSHYQLPSHSFIHTFIIRTLTYSFTIHSHSFIHSLTHLSTYLFTLSLILSALIPSFTLSKIHSVTAHSLILTLTQ